jgi:hypothetical protein
VYVCDGTDDREYARKRKFDVWFLLYNDGSIIKEDGIAMVEGTMIYNALLVHSQNKQKDHLLTAFKELNGKASDSK